MWPLSPTADPLAHGSRSLRLHDSAIALDLYFSFHRSYSPSTVMGDFGSSGESEDAGTPLIVL